MEQIAFAELQDRLINLYTDGKYVDALALVERHAGNFPEQAARTTFWRMCLLSLTNRPDDVLSVFREGLEAGLWWSEVVFIDSDLDAVRELPEFQNLMRISQEKYVQARANIEREDVILLPDELPSSGLYPVLITLHGRNGNKETDLMYWEHARQRGWLVLSAQSTQPLFPGFYCWDDAAQGLTDLLFYYSRLSEQYQIDPQRVVIGGMSQGSGMAIYAALTGKLPVRGFIGIGTWWADVAEFAVEAKKVRGYFVTGEKDHTLDRAREIQEFLRRHEIAFAEEVHPDLGHEFPGDFGTSFDNAMKYIFME
jgi:predicted esterase